MKMKRVYHHHTEWEDFRAGMWRKVPGEERDHLLKKAIEFTGNAALYGGWMLEVVKKWPKACAHNLSNGSLNKRAWVGHAACCMAINCPEDITREAWKFLSRKQQNEADAKAEEAIRHWEKTRKCGESLQGRLF